ncbi:MAG: hypothetical protein SFY32_14115 [Bacteroidota bacterium]|nr:hypothetical protein [Bacteroidota bacterium]
MIRKSVFIFITIKPNMIPNDFFIYTVEFSEHPIVNSSNQIPTVFDIQLQPNSNPSTNSSNVSQFDYKSYCIELLNKIKDLDLELFEHFLRYQSDRTIHPDRWLKSLEFLILKNTAFINDSNLQMWLSNKINTFLIIYNQSKQKPVYKKYNFLDVKKELGELETYVDKIKLLKIRMTEYLQAKVDHPNRHNHTYYRKLKLEEDLLTYLIEKSSIFEKSPKSPIDSQTIEPLRINSNINQFIDVFYQLRNEITVNRTPVLNCSIESLTTLLSTCFLDKDGRPISKDTIRTILNPSKTDKRPKEHNRLNIRF